MTTSEKVTFLGVVLAVMLFFAAGPSESTTRTLVTTDGTQTLSAKTLESPTITGTGISGINGSVASPAIRGTDADSGILFPTTGQQTAVSVNGSQRALFQGGSVSVVLAGGVGFGDGTTTADSSILRASAGVFRWTTTTFANLGTPSNGSIAFCSDCTKATPCADSGDGALAKRLNGAWDCD